MADVSVTFAVGSEQATVVLPVDLPTGGETLIGDVSGTFGDAHIAGDINLTGDLIIEGLLTGIDTFTLEGNGFQLLFQNGGRADLAGVERSGWVPWGGTPVGWQSGDLCGITSTKEGIFNPTGTTWTGSWATTVRSANSPDVTLPGGSIARPEVANLARSIVLKNLNRIHFHDGAGVQTLRYVNILDCGVTNVLAKYPLHFHLCGESVRGSLVEGVVVRNGKNHAFVPHGSHGITFRDCVAYNIINDAYWWDPPNFSDETHTANNSNDTVYDHCMAAYVWPNPGDVGVRLSAFALGAGARNSVRDSVATAVQGGKDAGGFVWPESANQNVGGNVWEFSGNVSHNNKGDGVFIWQNDSRSHLVEDFVAYRNGLSGIDHGAYDNRYHFKNMVLMGGSDGAFLLHAHGPIVIEDVVSDKKLRIMPQQSDATVFVTVRRCTFSGVYYSEIGGGNASKIRYEDCGIVPVNFDLSGIVLGSIIEIFEGGVLTHRWANGAWT